MREIKPIKLTKENFAPYGVYYNSKDENNYRRGDSWEAWAGPELNESGIAQLGLVLAAPGDFEVDSMERHYGCKELIMCGDGPNILCVANSDATGNPKEQDIIAFVMNPGDYVILNEKIWHDANRAIDKETYYYFYFIREDVDKPEDPSEIFFFPVEPEPVKVLVK